MKGIFIPEITVEMFRDGCLESIETLMTEGEVYDIEYDPKTAEPEIIRCRECKYAEVADKEDTQDGYICQFHRGSIWFSGSYCSWAERRTDE